MEIREHIKQMRNIQNHIISFIDDDTDAEENYQNLKELLDDQIFKTNKLNLKSLLNLIAKITDNHFRDSNFFEKIEKILLILESEIKEHFSSFEIFYIFKNNKKMLLHLIENNFMKMTKSIANILLTEKFNERKYLHYFFPEVKPFINDILAEKIQKEIPDNFDEKRKIGENNSHICHLIRNDLIDEFISYVKQTDLPLNSQIKNSIFETNIFLLKNKPFLIEYAAFFGSIQIFRYLKLNIKEGATTDSLMIYSVHGQHQEIIELLKEKRFDITSRIDCFIESVKCHHNSIANYIENNYINENNIEPDMRHYFSHHFFDASFHFHNYAYITDEFKSNEAFLNMCRYDYPLMAQIFMRTYIIHANESLLKGKNAIQIAAKNNCIELLNILLSLPGAEIDDDCFYGCHNLHKINIPNSITKISKLAFCGCLSLRTVTIPNSVTKIEHNAFNGCTSLFHINIPDSVSQIDTFAFCKCTSLENIEIPSSVTFIGAYAFQSCTSLRQIKIPSSISLIGYSVFQDCSSLRNVTIPQSVVCIDKFAFSGCSSLCEIEIPSSVSEIGLSAFEGCMSLSKISIPEKVTTIKKYSFYNCISLKEITIPKSTVSIGDFAFSGCKMLDNVVIPSLVESIGKSAFSGCSSLHIISLSDSLSEISQSVFKDCTSLTKVTIPSSVLKIGNYAFQDCSSLIEIDITETMRQISSTAFDGCKSFNTKSIPSYLFEHDDPSCHIS